MKHRDIRRTRRILDLGLRSALPIFISLFASERAFGLEPIVAVDFLRQAEATRDAQARVERDYVNAVVVRPRGESTIEMKSTTVGHLSRWPAAYRLDERPGWLDKKRGWIDGSLTQSFFDGERLFVFVPGNGGASPPIMKVGKVNYAVSAAIRTAPYSEASYGRLGERSMFDLLLEKVGAVRADRLADGNVHVTADLDPKIGHVDVTVSPSRGFRIVECIVTTLNPVGAQPLEGKSGPALPVREIARIAEVHLVPAGDGWYADHEREIVESYLPDGTVHELERTYDSSNIRPIPATEPASSQQLNIPSGTRGFPLDRTSPVPVEWDGHELVPSLDRDVVKRMSAAMSGTMAASRPPEVTRNIVAEGSQGMSARSALIWLVGIAAALFLILVAELVFLKGRKELRSGDGK